MIHRALRLIRVFHEMPQFELAAKLGISGSYLSEIENGRKGPSLDLLRRYGAVFDIPTSSIVLLAEKIAAAGESDAPLVSDKVVKLLAFVGTRTRSEKRC
jgi:transcriptional regulator with XRE-family HTH domain